MKFGHVNVDQDQIYDNIHYLVSFVTAESPPNWDTWKQTHLLEAKV